MGFVVHDIECEVHGPMLDELVNNATIESGTVACPKDGTHRCRIVYNKVARAAGIIWSNQEHSKQLGVTFETNEQKRQYMKDNPNVIEFSKGDDTDRRIAQRSAERADKSARAWGYRHEQHRKEEVRGALSKGWRPS